MCPRLWIWPGIIPILHSSGVIIPGQLGPINRLFEPISARLTFTISSIGMPSVIQIINSIFASIASSIAAAANLAGTYITVAFAPVFSLASATVLKTGKLR